MKYKKMLQYLNLITFIIFILAILYAIYIMKNGMGLIDGLHFGSGSYYYSDIPGWEKIFYTSDSITPNTTHPLLFILFFIGWGTVSWKTWVYLDRKLK